MITLQVYGFGIPKVCLVYIQRRCLLSQTELRNSISRPGCVVMPGSGKPDLFFADIKTTGKIILRNEYYLAGGFFVHFIKYGEKVGVKPPLK